MSLWSRGQHINAEEKGQNILSYQALVTTDYPAGGDAKKTRAMFGQRISASTSLHGHDWNRVPTPRQ